MSANYHFIFTRHPLDGLRLALHSIPEGVEEPLIMITRGGFACPMAYGYSVPSEYSGITGLLQYQSQQVAVSLTVGNRVFRVIFPSDGLHPTVRYAEVLDRLRDKLETWPHIAVVVVYDKMEEDLPPLCEGDSLSAFWEIRDHLNSDDLRRLENVIERAESEYPAFSGIQLYQRSGELGKSREREASLRATMKGFLKEGVSAL